MSDIQQRLRKAVEKAFFQDTHSLLSDALAEIERLNAEPPPDTSASSELRQLLKYLGVYADGCNVSAELHPEKAAYYHGKRKGLQEAMSAIDVQFGPLPEPPCRRRRG